MIDFRLKKTYFDTMRPPPESPLQESSLQPRAMFPSPINTVNDQNMCNRSISVKLLF